MVYLISFVAPLSKFKIFSKNIYIAIFYRKNTMYLCRINYIQQINTKSEIYVKKILKVWKVYRPQLNGCFSF